MNWFKYLALLAALASLVAVYPFLWELGLVGAIGGAIWIFTWPKGDGRSDRAGG